MRRFRETVVLPTVADMQHEWCEAGESRRDRAQALVRGYAGVLAGAALYALLMPARHVREIWWGRTAPAVALLRASVSATLAYTLLLLVPHFLAATVRSGWLFLPNAVGPGVFIWFPAAFAIGVGRSIASVRDETQKRRWTRAVPGIGVLGAVLCFMWALQGVGPYRRLLQELYTHGHVAPLVAEAPGRPSVAPLAIGPGLRLPVDTRNAPPPWHRWLMRPAACVSLVLLAAALAWSTYPQLLPPVVLVAFLFSHILWPRPLPSWHFHAAPLMLAAIVRMSSMTKRRVSR